MKSEEESTTAKPELSEHLTAKPENLNTFDSDFMRPSYLSDLEHDTLVTYLFMIFHSVYHSKSSMIIYLLSKIFQSVYQFS